MSKTRSDAIILHGEPNLVEETAGGAIQPGDHLIYDGSGDLIAGGANHGKLLRVATENTLEGNDITTSYADGDRVYAHVPKAGDRVQLRVAAGAAAIVKGDLLELAASGEVIKLNAGTARAEAMEAIDNSGGGTTVLINAAIL